jgi:pyruvate/2-oxoglutarate dehydrogenase complex dihydrolipoamide dehydrogenase (E3) component
VYDIIIMGAGPGGYVAAERAGARGKKVLIIEKENLGGVCLKDVFTQKVFSIHQNYIKKQKAARIMVSMRIM